MMIAGVLGSGVSAMAETKTVLARLNEVGCSSSTGVGQISAKFFVKKKLIEAKMNIWNEYLCDTNSRNDKLSDYGLQAVFYGKIFYITFNKDYVVTDMEPVENRYTDEVKSFEKRFNKKFEKTRLVDHRILQMEWSDRHPELVEKIKQSARADN